MFWLSRNYKAAVGVCFILVASQVSARAAIYNIVFTDSNGDVANLFFNTASPISAGGTLVTSITGTFNGLSVTEASVFGANQKIYSSGPFVDYSGVGFTNPTSFNLYWTDPTHSFAQGGYGVCYESSCGQSSGFYAVQNLTVTAVPELSAWTMMLLGFAGLGFVGYRGSRKTAASPA